MKRLRKWRPVILLSVAILMLSVATLTAWYIAAGSPRKLALSLYTSPPVSLDGKITTRLQVLAPTDWKQRNVLHVVPQVKVRGAVTVILSKVDDRPTAIRALRRLFGLEHERNPNEGIWLTFRESNESAGNRVVVQEVTTCDPASAPLRKAIRNIYSGKTRHTLSFIYEDGPEFTATYRHICESFRVIPGERL